MAQLFNPALPKNYNPFAWLEQMQKRYLAQNVMPTQALNPMRLPTIGAQLKPPTQPAPLFNPLSPQQGSIRTSATEGALFRPPTLTPKPTRAPKTESNLSETLKVTTEPKPPPILGTDIRAWDLTTRRIENRARQVPDEWRKTWDDLSQELKEQMSVWKQDSVNAFLKAYAERDWDAVNRIANAEAERQAQQARNLQQREQDRDKLAFTPQYRKSAYVAG